MSRVLKRLLQKRSAAAESGRNSPSGTDGGGGGPAGGKSMVGGKSGGGDGERKRGEPSLIYRFDDVTLLPVLTSTTQSREVT